VSYWVQLIVSGITIGSIYALVALGYVTIYRTSLVVNLAQGSFMMLGALFTYSLLTELGLPYWFSGVISVVGVTCIGVAMYVLVLKRIVKVSLGAMILGTVALSLVFENVALLKWGSRGKSIPRFTDAHFLVNGVSISSQSLWIIGLMVVIVAGLFLLTTKTRLGKQMTATATQASAASLVGISTTRMVLFAFGISAGIGAIGGIAIAPVSTISYMSGGILGLNGFVAAVLGGWGSSTGAVIGGLALGLIQSLVSGVLPTGYQDAIAFALLIVILYFRPQGLVGIPMAEGEEAR